MATNDNFRYQYGDTNPVNYTYNTSNAISLGDCCWVDSGNSYNLKSANVFTWATAIADPSSAPTIADSGAAASPGFGAGTYKVQYTYVTADGLESGPSALSTGATITATHGITASGVALAAGTVAVNWYVTAAGGSSATLVATNNGGTITFTGPPPSTAVAPPAANGLSALVLTQVGFCKAFVGVAAQRYDGVKTTAIGINDGTLRVDTSGVFEFDTAASSLNPGDLVGLDTASSLLLPQQVALVTNKALAIGRVQNPTFNVVGSVNRVKVQVYGTKNYLNRVTF